MPADTLPQAEEKQRMQLQLTDEAAKRIRIAAGARNISFSEIVSELAEEHLPAPPKNWETRSAR